MKITLQDLVELVAGELVSGPDDVTLTGYESLKNARNSDVSFVINPSMLAISQRLTLQQ